ncbi:MAG: NTP transferase domain-containing protein [Bacteroidales bacterium]|nr:NTP transferase domain-containing protein [Bacteroidales bacterium]
MYPFIILAAGNSSRMGQPKPFVKINSQLTLLEYLVSGLKNCNVSQITVVLNNEGKKIIDSLYSYLNYEINIVINQLPEKGRLYSLKMGLSKIGSSSVFIQNVDNPFINKKLIFEMSHLLKPSAFVVPVYQNQGGHPVLLSAEITSSLISNQTETNNFRVFLSQYQKIRYACEFQEILLNLNCPSDIEAFKKKFKKF